MNDDTLTDEEIEFYRRQKREGNRLAREAAIRMGITVHPRIADARKDRQEPTP